jgi:uncharacterized protein
MERKEIKSLIDWKNKSSRMPLVMKGARQVGKTWLLKTFGQQFYDQVAYINFETSSGMKQVFKNDFNLNRILFAIQIETGILPNESTLIIFDEIQECPEALLALKYFHETAPQLPIVSAGSLLGVTLSNQASFPVGKVEFLDLYPLNFPEFLSAIGQESLVKLLESNDWELIKSYKEKFKQYLRYYYFIGGMPEAVSSFSQNSDFSLVREIQQKILTSYEFDFAKHIPLSILAGVRLVWNIIPSQLAKENRKFIFKNIRQGARAKDYEMAIVWLLDSGLIYKLNNVDKVSIPLKVYEDFNAFKLFVLDIGLLGAMVNLDITALNDSDNVLEEYKGSLTEQFVMQQIQSLRRSKPYYWSLPNSQAELDFLIEYKSNIIPIEVKAAENLHSKSLKSFYQKHSQKLSIRCSMSDYRNEGWLINLPLYAIHRLYNVIEEGLFTE